MAEHFQPIHLGQLQVQQDQARRIFEAAIVVLAPAKQVVERFFTVVRDGDPIGQVVRAKRVDGQFLVGWTVLHQQYFDFVWIH
jgi:hypothetical protein